MLDKNAVNNVIDNPLNAFNYPEFIAAIAAHLDVAISLEGYQESFKAGVPMTKSPISNCDLCGAITFGFDKEHAKVTDCTIANLLSQGKSLGNINLWYAVIYFIVKGKPQLNIKGIENLGQVVQPADILSFEEIKDISFKVERL